MLADHAAVPPTPPGVPPLVPLPSPNFGVRRAPAGRSRPTVDILLLHYTGMPSAAAALDRLTDPASGVSAHYTIDEDGTVYRHVGEDARAWHAGAGLWRADTDVNSRSIGIELVNPGHAWGYRPFAEPQMAALIALARDILARHPIGADGVLAHSDVAPARKQDPGELFDWRRLAAAGIGLWPVPTPDDDAWAVREAESAGGDVVALLARYGYGVRSAGMPSVTAVVTAFQRHFVPERVTGTADRVTRARLSALLRATGR